MTEMMWTCSSSGISLIATPGTGMEFCRAPEKGQIMMNLEGGYDGTYEGKHRAYELLARGKFRGEGT